MIFVRILYLLTWITFFFLATRRGLLDKVSPYPLATLLGAFSWNVVYALSYDPSINLLDWITFWFFCIGDGIIMVLLFKYYQDKNKKPFYIWFFTTFSYLIWLEYLLRKLLIIYSNLSHEKIFGYTICIYYVIYELAFTYQTLIKKDIRGQSIYTALMRVLGVALYTVLAIYAYKLDISIYGVFAFFCFCAQIMHIASIYSRCKEEGIHPWSRI
ncbi:hypothetical protein NIES4073_78030 [Kalymmatonema gypsitolerans NIES-4073]|nr:hypothetical protein NIES4073_78030 [Scytonema sp. NIES-4073]